MIDYQENYFTLLSYKSLKEKIYNNNRVFEEINIPTKTTKKYIKTKASDIDFKEDNALLIIKNDDILLSELINIKKQNPPMMYITVENNGNYIIILIKLANSWPLHVIKIDVDNINVLVNDVNSCYLIPFEEFKDVEKPFKNNINYILSLVNNNNLELKIKTESSEIIIKNGIQKINKNALLEFIKLNNSHNDIDIPRQIAYNIDDNVVSCLLNMNTYIIKNIKNSSLEFDFNNKNFNNIYIKITDNNMHFIINGNRSKQKILICDDTNSLKFNVKSLLNNNKSQKYELQKYNSLVKPTAIRALMNKNKIYYIFCKYVNIYMFVKVISSNNITFSKNNDIINNLFTNHIILECYACIDI